MSIRYPYKFIRYDLIPAEKLEVGDEFTVFVDSQGFWDTRAENGTEVYVTKRWSTVAQLDGEHGPGIYSTDDAGRSFAACDNRYVIRRRKDA